MVLDSDALGSFSDRVVREWEDAASLGLSGLNRWTFRPAAQPSPGTPV